MVVTVVGCSGGASGGGFGEHGGGCPLAADELGDATLDTCRAVWVQPAAPATRTAAIAARRAGRNCQADTGITVLRRTVALRSLVQPPRSRRQRQMTASVRTIGLALAVATGTIGQLIGDEPVPERSQHLPRDAPVVVTTQRSRPSPVTSARPLRRPFSGVADAQLTSDVPEHLAVYGCLWAMVAAVVVVTVAASAHTPLPPSSRYGPHPSASNHRPAANGPPPALLDPGDGRLPHRDRGESTGFPGPPGVREPIGLPNVR